MEKIVQFKVSVEGKGKSKELAINTALGKIQRKVMDEFKAMIIRIEPVSIDVIEAIEHTYTERFLLFFFPRKRSVYKVVIDVDVKITLLKVEDIDFKKIESPDGIVNNIFRNGQVADK
ncbi:hypothetical protein J27TS8_25980 [Robertmurraya siralis]|uniref:DUF4312 family protein n=1 Tax=Robertmurraya siralis TaxID=77777 RepID=A0A919WIJ9_9BACI|nr:DUF4312 family protein [Robertmurraya siralis]GIN62605.1 hypothetical protein J27TS8_25980 [Robertmurraya siralis]